MTSTLLCEIAAQHKTDKVQHGYTPIYDRLMGNDRFKPIKILEIGIYMGSSIKMWRDYFPNGTIIGIDNGRICSDQVMDSLRSDRVHIEKCDQSNRDDLQNLITKYGSDFDIILDDGHHFQEPQQVSWGFLFPHVKKGGMYIIEDVIIPMHNYPSINDPDNCWGIRDYGEYTDTTWHILLELIKSRPNYAASSPYMIDGEMQYIIEHIRKTHYGLDLSIVTNGTCCFAYMRKD